MITFEPGEAVALIRIPIVDNTAVENNETFIAALSSEDSSVVIDDKSVTIMILDPDCKYSKRIAFFHVHVTIFTHSSLLPKLH